MKIGGNDDSSFSFPNYESALEYAVSHTEIKGAPNPNATSWCVVVCSECGELTWGLHRTIVCKDCKKTHTQKVMKRNRENYKRNPEPAVFERGLYTAIQKAKVAGKISAEKIRRAAVWNEEHSCPLGGSESNCERSVKCFFCLRGKDYAGPANLSERRCCYNPISVNGVRYVQRATNRKISNSGDIICEGEKFDVADNMSQFAKEKLVERMHDVGREFYLWSNGHLDITPEPDSYSELREVRSEEQ